MAIDNAAERRVALLHYTGLPDDSQNRVDRRAVQGIFTPQISYVVSSSNSHKVRRRRRTAAWIVKRRYST